MDVNQAACQFYGYSRQELTTMNMFQINQLPLHKLKMMMANALNQETLAFNFQHQVASGKTRDVEVFSGPVTIGGGKRLHSIIFDVTERKQIEDAFLFLAQSGSTASSKEFFKSLTRFLAKKLGMDYVCIDRLKGDHLTAQTLAVYFDCGF